MLCTEENHPIAEVLKVTARAWPQDHKGPRPGDFENFAAKGMGLAAPLITQPWTKLEDLEKRPSFYGAEAHVGRPILDAPTNDAIGGCVYLDGGAEPQEIAMVARAVGVDSFTKDYVVFFDAAADILQQRFIHQIRLIRRYALSSMFGVPEKEFASYTEQPITIVAAMTLFAEAEQEIWGAGMSPKLYGAMGGDGDWAKESLGFGLLSENAYQGVFRIWSRAWLVTK